jgi:glutamate carboxypeptidase
MTPASQWISNQLEAMDAALEALVTINSFTQNKTGGNQVVRLLEDVFSMPDLHFSRVGSERFADHVVLKSEGNKSQPVALIGHLDTVFPPGFFEGYKSEGPLRKGPGVLDMKGGLVVIAWALKAIAATVGLNSICPLKIVIVSDEEVGSPEGAPLIRHEIVGSRAALVFESGRANDAIVTQRKGTASVTVKATGKAAHAGNNYFEGKNAIWALARFIDRAQNISDKTKDITVNVGLVSGGTSKNTVPAAASAEIDLRFPTKEAKAEIFDRLDISRTDAHVDGTTLEVTPGSGRDPMERVEGTAGLVLSYAACAHTHGLGNTEALRQGGGSDGNTAAAMGIPTIDALGPRGRFFHTPEEYIEVETLVLRASALADWLLSQK